MAEHRNGAQQATQPRECTDEALLWSAVPDWPEYRLSLAGEIEGVARTAVSRHGRSIRVKAEKLTPQVHPTNRLHRVTLQRGGRGGERRTVYIHRLLCDVFGPEAAATYLETHSC
jgi:hypothetical protein